VTAVAPAALTGTEHSSPAREAATARLWRWSGNQLDPRKNSLNLVRLALALAVLYHHSFPLGGFEGHPDLLGVQLGGWAVFGFFCISGYLITGSRLVKPLGSYLVLRIARIYPAFWVCLGVTVAVFAPLDFMRTHGTLDGYLTSPGITPLDYLVVNATLQINSYGIGETLASNPYPVAWNGSLWTLYYEFICYLLVGALACFGWWRRSAWPVSAAFLLSVLALANADVVLPYVALNADVRNLLTLVPFFLGGAVVHMLRARLPLHWTGALVAALGVYGALQLSPVWGLQLSAPLMTYALLWIGSVVKAPGIALRNDLSYGVYIYAFPVQQLLASFGVQRHGVLLYTVAAAALTIPLAAMSWFVIERPVMRRARSSVQRLRAPRDVVAALPEPVPSGSGQESP
jgi:peptidoglycan/LPS O-acetylase OafA/YrhL